MQVFYIKIKLSDNRIIDEKVKAVSEANAVAIIQEKYPICIIISIKQLLTD